MILEIVNVVLIVLFALIVLLILDWVFGIDKLNTYVSDFLDKHTDAEIVAPFIGLILISEFGMIIDWITGNQFIHTAYLAIGLLALSLGLLIIGFIIVGKILYAIRQYFLSRKKL